MTSTTQMFCTPPQWIGGEKRGHRVTYVSGLRQWQDGHITSYFDNGEVEIDYGLRHLIMELNVRGFETQYCCSGLPEDHRSRRQDDCGYIAFTESVTELLPHLNEPLFFDGRCTWPCIRMRPKIGVMKRRAAWKTLLKTIAANPALHRTP